MPFPPPGRCPLRTVLLAVLAAGALSACSTKRTITIDSEPRGARVFVEGTERGVTPVTLPFVYYGDAEVRLEKEGYASIATVLVVPTRIDGYPIVDLPFELAVRRRHFAWKGTLTPLAAEPSDAEIQEMRRRAEAMRARTRREATREALGARPGSPRPATAGPPAAAPLPDAAPPLVRPRGR